MKLAAILLLAMGITLCAQSQAPKTGEVTFEFVFSSGVFPLDGRLIIDSANGRVYDEAVNAEAKLRLAYGKYLILSKPPVSRRL